MKVLAFNASPRKDRGNTDTLLNQFIEGAQKAGADVEKHHIVDLDINGCRSCFTCWWKTPGKCVHRDDMDWILPKLGEADILLFGTPIFGNNITHYMQRLAERTFPISLPEMIMRDGEVTHPGRQRKIPQIVVAATCGFPESSPFNIVRGLYPTALHILLPAGQILQYDETKDQFTEFLNAIKTAGETLAQNEPVSDSLKEKLVVEYTDEMKREIMEKHNLYSASRSKSL
jgi:multimeric flavodoxin WrbA